MRRTLTATLLCLMWMYACTDIAMAGNNNGVPPGPPPGDEQPASVTNEGDTVYEEEEPAASGPGAVYSESYGCDSSGASGSVKAGGFGVASPTYPCEIMRTYEAIERTEGKGFVLGFLPRVFLKTRLITKGIFSAVFGLLGLG